jgi:hypothetical protein
MDHCAEKGRLAEEFTRAAEEYAKAYRASIGDTTKVLDEIERARRLGCVKGRAER